MKHLEYFVLVSCMVVFVACNQDSRPVYSCNKAVNEQVEDYFKEIQIMNRSEWNLLDEMKKAAAYKAFTPNQRIQFWEDKFDELKELDWTHEESLHIESARQFILENRFLFSGIKLTDEESDKLHEFCYLWVKKGMNDFDWKEELALAIIAAGNTVLNKNGELLMKGPFPYVEGSDGGPSETPNCNCHESNYFFHMCGLNSSCEDVDCNGSDSGCGFLLAESCNGRCY